MSIKFDLTEFPGRFVFTSKQLPGWQCSGPNQATAAIQRMASLKNYLGGDPYLDEEVQEQLRNIISSARHDKAQQPFL